MFFQKFDFYYFRIFFLSVSFLFLYVWDLTMIKDNETKKDKKKKRGCEKKRPFPSYILWKKDQWNKVKPNYY